MNTKKENDLIIHFTEKLPANIDAEVNAKVDGERSKHYLQSITALHI